MEFALLLHNLPSFGNPVHFMEGLYFLKELLFAQGYNCDACPYPVTVNINEYLCSWRENTMYEIPRFWYLLSISVLCHINPDKNVTGSSMPMLSSYPCTCGSALCSHTIMMCQRPVCLY